MTHDQFLIVFGLLLMIYGSGEVNEKRDQLALDRLDALIMIVGLIALASGTAVFLYGLVRWLL